VLITRHQLRQAGPQIGERGGHGSVLQHGTRGDGHRMTEKVRLV
jgi:hypothetical protein